MGSYRFGFVLFHFLMMGELAHGKSQKDRET